MSISSLIPVDKAKIRKACIKAIEMVHLERMKRFNADVEEAMKPRWSWFRKVARTRQEAEMYVNTLPSDFVSALYYYKWYNSDVIERADRLLMSMDACDGNVAYLTVSDAVFVQSRS